MNEVTLGGLRQTRCSYLFEISTHSFLFYIFREGLQIKEGVYEIAGRAFFGAVLMFASQNNTSALSNYPRTVVCKIGKWPTQQCGLWGYQSAVYDHASFAVMCTIVTHTAQEKLLDSGFVMLR